MIIEQIFSEGIHLKVSDIHLRESELVIYRKEGDLQPSEKGFTPSREEMLQSLAHFLAENPVRLKHFETEKEIDF
jgi:Tfp pilus assembly pilus retraction ATPase PilT